MPLKPCKAAPNAILPYTPASQASLMTRLDASVNSLQVCMNVMLGVKWLSNRACTSVCRKRWILTKVKSLKSFEDFEDFEDFAFIDLNLVLHPPAQTRLDGLS